MFLTSEAGNFLIIAIIAVFIIAFTLVIYLLITTKKGNEKKSLDNDFNTQSESELNNPVNEIQNSNTVQEFFEPATEKLPVNDFNLIEEASKIASNDLVEENNKNLEVIETKEEPTITNTSEIKEETDIESVLNKMQQDLNSLEKNESEIARYEEEEEKNAIISYKELMKYKDSQDKDIVLEEKDKNEIKEIIESPTTVKKFKRSEFISPIFGYNDDSNVTYREIKRPPRKEKVKDSPFEWESDRILRDLSDSNAEVIEFEEKEDNVSDNTNRFLDELVDFRKKLD